VQGGRALTSRDSLASWVVPVGLASKILLAVSGSLLIALSAQLRIDLPFSPVPVTGQTFAVLLVGALFGARLGLATVAAYLIEGTMGAAVFAGGTAGPQILLGPTGGYLVGFAAAAFVVGLCADRGWDRRLPTALLVMCLGNAVIYVFGVAWLARFVGSAALSVGLVPFIAGDAYKVLLAAATVPAAWALFTRLALGSRSRRR
jgi:biotin transport system substrate-specific component